jgi:hypothetical protein
MTNKDKQANTGKKDTKGDRRTGPRGREDTMHVSHICTYIGRQDTQDRPKLLSDTLYIIHAGHTSRLDIIEGRALSRQATHAWRHVT